MPVVCLKRDNNNSNNNKFNNCQTIIACKRSSSSPFFFLQLQLQVAAAIEKKNVASLPSKCCCCSCCRLKTAGKKTFSYKTLRKKLWIFFFRLHFKVETDFASQIKKKTNTLPYIQLQQHCLTKWYVRQVRRYFM